jgi:23S rRNA (cytosine1962-C5)-methyltransferase
MNQRNNERPKFGRQDGKTEGAEKRPYSATTKPRSDERRANDRVQDGQKTPFWANRGPRRDDRSKGARDGGRGPAKSPYSSGRKPRSAEPREAVRETGEARQIERSPYSRNVRSEDRPRVAREGGRMQERPQPRSPRQERPRAESRPRPQVRGDVKPRRPVKPVAQAPRPQSEPGVQSETGVQAVIGAIVVNRRAAARLRSGNPWGYRSDTVSAEGVAPGGIAPVQDERGKLIGTALYSSSSQIALRMISSERLDSEDELLTLVRSRLQAAVYYRNRVVEGTEAYRVVFSEGDLLPGLIVDRYNDVFSVQILTQAMDRHGVRDALVQSLVDQFNPAGIVERVDARIRELEELPPRESGMLWGTKSATTFNMNGLQFHFDGLTGQKTGAFLDQRENYLAAAKFARGEALDVFCYQGGFALHLARVCDRVTGVDSSRPALEVAEQNLTANADELRSREVEVDWIEANAFDLLRDYADAGRQYDTIVLDPPAFAKSKKVLDTAIRGYKELNLRGLKMVRPGGTFVTCSCSHHVSEADFLNMLADAATDSHRTVRIVEKRSQAKDHPILLSMPETQYLKCVVAIVD